MSITKQVIQDNIEVMIIIGNYIIINLNSGSIKSSLERERLELLNSVQVPRAGCQKGSLQKLSLTFGINILFSNCLGS